jgi:hypothetical protein
MMIKKWVIAGFAYLVLVMAGYTVYDTINPEPDMQKPEARDETGNEGLIYLKKT